MASTKNSAILISCLCGNSRQELSPADSPIDWAGISFCHCNSCRHHTGILCTSYLPIASPPESLAGLQEYASPTSSRWFCGTCGCHIFRSSRCGKGVSNWEVATGTIVKSESVEENPGDAPKLPSTITAWTHRHVEDTKDGGVAVWLGHSPDHVNIPNKDAVESQHPVSTESHPDSLPASCICSNVQFLLTRPNASSSEPRSNFSDLIHPYYTSPEDIVSNPANEKWWLCGGGTKYLAGTCACRSCRLITGFEIQTWAFVPRINIQFCVSSEGRVGEETKTVPLDFTTLQAGILQSYESSPGVLREFCPRCGATVFWHDKWRPDLIDVSVGLLHADGARAEDWLAWWKGRVSFAEDAEEGRQGGAALRARILVEGLTHGLGE